MSLLWPWVRQIDAGLSLQRSGFDYPSLPVRFVAYKMALRQIFIRVSFYQYSILIFIFYLCFLPVGLRAEPGTFKLSSVPSDVAGHWT